MEKIFINDKPLYVGKDMAVGGELFPFELKSEMDLRVLFELFRDTRIEGGIWNSTEVDTAILKLKMYSNYIQAAGGLVFKDKQLLGIHRLGKWDLPKGKQEPGESISSTALREVEEECGISGLKEQQYISSTWHMYLNQYNNNEICLKRTFWYWFSYGGDQTPVAQTEEQILECRWFDQKEKEILLKGTYASLRDLIERNF